jgi:hypothetical protein
MQLQYIPMPQSEPLYPGRHVHTSGAVQLPPFKHVKLQTGMSQ